MTVFTYVPFVGVIITDTESNTKDPETYKVDDTVAETYPKNKLKYVTV